MGISNASDENGQDEEDEDDSVMKARYDREESRALSEDEEEEPCEQDALIMQRLGCVESDRNG